MVFMQLLVQTGNGVKVLFRTVQLYGKAKTVH